MSEKTEMQYKFIRWLQKSEIDFFRIGNAAFIKKVTSPYSYGIDKKGIPCHKYWPDVIFPYKGIVYMIEFGIPGRNTARKEKQATRGAYWHANGSVCYKQIYSWSECENLITGLLRG